VRRGPLAVAVAALALVASACVPPAEETTTPERFDPDTVMGEIQARGELRIGIASDRPPFGLEDEGGDGAGLTADLGAYVAEALNVEPAYVPAPNDELLEMVESNEVDLVFPITAITEPLVRHYGFTDPYWIAHQRVLGFDGRYAPDELAGETVCSFVDPETEVLLSDLEPTIDVVSATQPEECAVRLTAGVPATASDAILLGLLQELEETGDGSERPSIGGDNLTTEGYGAAVNIESSGLAEVVNNILERAQEDGTWQRAVDAWLEGAEPVEPPELTVEEAAALYPANA
jgi:ABC-type amino acid transport substrate-binding protein